MIQRNSRFKSFIAAIAVTLVTLPAFAQQGQVATVEEGEPAPFAGTLLSPEAVARILAEREGQESLCQERITHELNLQQINHELQLDLVREQITLLQGSLDNLRQSRDLALETLDTSLRFEARRGLLNNSTFVFVLGVATGGALLTLNTYVLQ